MVDTKARPTFAALLKGYRLARGLSQEALADRAGLSRGAVNLLERGRRLSPRGDTVALLAKTLKLTSDERARLLFAATPDRGRAASAPSRRAGSPGALPLRLTSFVGREREISELRGLVQSKRLITLTGTGGIGKTSLAREVARAVEDQFPDGVALVELAALTDGELVPQAIAAALGVREQPGEALLTTLRAVLRTTQRLLLLDNCEHVVGACARVAEMLVQDCPRLQLLVTSREPLRVGTEVIWRVPALTLPGSDTPPLAELAKSEAVRLFVERAQAVRPAFALSEGDQAATAEICRRLDGIPLAIELAAARTAVLPPEQIAHRLGDRFRLLTIGNRTALPRHQTLRALIDWSYELLSSPERVLFRRLAVFAGGWPLEAAEAVCSDGGAPVLLPIPDATPDAQRPIPPDDVLDLLTQLHAKSLVQVEEREAEVRFRLLETLRQYGWDRLVEAGEDQAVRDRHRDWFLHLAERAKPELTGLRQGEWLGRLEVEHDNLRAALGWALESGPAEVGPRLVSALWRLWHRHDHRREGREWLARVLAAPGAEAPTIARAEALDGACELCGLALNQGDRAEAGRLAEESLAIYRALDDRRGIAGALGHLAMVANQEGDQSRTEALGEEALTLARAAGNHWVAAQALETLGLAAVQRGDRPLARQRLAEGVTIFRDLGDDLSVANALQWLGWVASLQGENRAARACFEEALTLARALGSKGRMGGPLRFLGMLARVEGDYARARSFLEESDAVARQTGDRGLSALALLTQGWLARDEGDRGRAEASAREGLSVARDAGVSVLLLAVIGLLGIVAIDRGSYQQGIRLLARSDVGPSAGWWLLPDEVRAHQESLRAARVALGEPDFAMAWAEGRAMTLERAMAYALERSKG